jgi:ribonuclease D
MVECSKQPPDYARAYTRLKGGNYLDESSLRVLSALAAWREKTADEQNLARGFVLPDPVLLQLAADKPESESELSKIPGIH